MHSLIHGTIKEIKTHFHDSIVWLRIVVYDALISSSVFYTFCMEGE